MRCGRAAGRSNLASDVAWLRAMVDVEVALAAASAEVGFIPASHASLIESASKSLVIDTAAIAHEASDTGTPVVALVTRLRAAVGSEVAASVHRGATSQDVVDTASMVVASNAVAAIVNDLAAAANRAAKLAADHRTTPIAGRTLLQQAVPTTFGLKAANWAVGIDRAGGGSPTFGRQGLRCSLAELPEPGRTSEGTARRSRSEWLLASDCSSPLRPGTRSGRASGTSPLPLAWRPARSPSPRETSSFSRRRRSPKSRKAFPAEVAHLP